MDAERRKIVERYSKLLRLARSATSPHEADTAQKAADKLASDHLLTDTELQTEQMSLAFDDLLDVVKKIVENHHAIPAGLFDTETIISNVLGKIKNISPHEKAKKLCQFAVIVRTTSLIAGENATLREIKAALETTLKNHELTV